MVIRKRYQFSPKIKVKKQKNNPNDSVFFDTAIVGTKGQFVIPKEAREAYDIKSGDKILIFGGKGGVLAIIKAEMLHEVLDGIDMPDMGGK